MTNVLSFSHWVILVLAYPDDTSERPPLALDFLGHSNQLFVPWDSCANHFIHFKKPILIKSTSKFYCGGANILLFADLTSQQVACIFTITVKREIDNKLVPVTGICLWVYLIVSADALFFLFFTLVHRRRFFHRLQWCSGVKI